MKTSPESRLNPIPEVNLSDAASVAQSPGSQSTPANTTSPSQAESLLTAEKRTLEMIANGASLAEVLNDLCTAIDAYAPPLTSMVLLVLAHLPSPCLQP